MLGVSFWSGRLIDFLEEDKKIDKLIDKAYELKKKGQALRVEAYKLQGEDYQNKAREFRAAFVEAVLLFDRAMNSPYFKNDDFDDKSSRDQKTYFGIAFCYSQLALSFGKNTPERIQHFSNALKCLDYINHPTCAHEVLYAECYEQLGEVNSAIRHMENAIIQLTQNKEHMLQKKKAQCVTLKRKMDAFCERHPLSISTPSLDEPSEKSDEKPILHKHKVKGARKAPPPEPFSLALSNSFAPLNCDNSRSRKHSRVSK